MGNLSLVDELLGADAGAGTRGVADFAATVAASNGMLIPFELLVQARLPASAESGQALLFERESRHKMRLLDTDRPVFACVCDIVAADVPAPGALAACITALAPAPVPRVLAVTLERTALYLHALLAEVEVAEVIMRVPLDAAARATAATVKALRARLPAPTAARLLAVLCDGDAGPCSCDDRRALLAELAEQVNLVCTLPLLTRETRPPRRTGREHYLEVADALEQLGFVRVAPALFALRRPGTPSPALPWLNRIMGRLPQADVLGLGPAARSRFNEMNFDNHADPAVHAREVQRGRYGIARTYASSPVEQFVDALLVKLASGSVVDVDALAVRCQCDSPAFLEACDKTFDGLRSHGALSGRDTRCIEVNAGNDCHFGETRARLAELRGALPAVAAFARR
jgi:hypothetical protein